MPPAHTQHGLVAVAISAEPSLIQDSFAVVDDLDCR
jgi:hypothetical protein